MHNTTRRNLAALALAGAALTLSGTAHAAGESADPDPPSLTFVEGGVGPSQGDAPDVQFDNVQFVD
ncbi:hypothetical protein [Streptomyces virginiae]|uniref:hypothetical protein n=1 Tax=Streptomyces virginiae TaxID=1961 RepID=UPI0036EF9577